MISFQGQRVGSTTPVYIVESAHLVYPSVFGSLEEAVDGDGFVVPVAFSTLESNQESSLYIEGAFPLSFVGNSDSVVDTLFDWESCCVTDSSGDQTFTQPFADVESVVVTHNLGKYPSVSASDLAGQGFLVDYRYLNLDTIEVSWVSPRSGTIVLN